MPATNEYIEKIKGVLQNKKNADVYILNDKLTLSVFTVLEKSLKNVRHIYLIIRGNQQLPRDEVTREFEMNPNDTLYNEYDIVEKNELTHFAKAKTMHDFILKNVEIRRLTSRANVGFNILIIDDDFMLTGTTSLELNDRRSEQRINFNSVISGDMDKSQILKFKNEFERIWLSEQITYDFKDELLNSLAYVYKEHSPEFAYYFTLNQLYGDKIDESVQRFERDNAGFKDSVIWNMLFDFQKEAVRYAIEKINRYNGCIIADSVDILVLTPAKLYNNWDSYRDNDYEDNPLADDVIKYKVMCHTDLSRYSGTSKSGYDLARFDWSRFDLIVIDESHNFRNRTEKEESETRYQRLLETVVKKKTHTKVLLLSATPVNNSLTDLKNQITLITGDHDDAYSKEGIESVAQTLRKASVVFNAWEKQGYASKEELYDSLPKDFFDLLELLTISRSRKHITNYYKSENIGTFPIKLPVSTYNPNIDTQRELLNFKETLLTLEDLQLAAYTPMKYIKREYREMYQRMYQTIHKGKVVFTQEGREYTTKILQLFNLFKRLESSVYAFLQTLNRQCERINNYIFLLKGNGTELSDEVFSDDEETSLDYKLDIKVAHLDKEAYLNDLIFDKVIIERLIDQAGKILAHGRDEKLIQLKKIIKDKTENTPFNARNRKILIFSAFADTAKYLYEVVSGELLSRGYYTGMVSGSDKPHTTIPQNLKPVQKGGRKVDFDFNKVLTYFSPISKNANIPEDRQITVENELIDNKNLWYDEERAKQIFPLLKQLKFVKLSAAKARTISEKSKLNFQIKEIIGRLETITA